MNGQHYYIQYHKATDVAKIGHWIQVGSMAICKGLVFVPFRIKEFGTSKTTIYEDSLVITKTFYESLRNLVHHLYYTVEIMIQLIEYEIDKTQYYIVKDEDVLYIVDTNIGAYYRNGNEVQGMVAYELIKRDLCSIQQFIDPNVESKIGISGERHYIDQSTFMKLSNVILGGIRSINEVVKEIPILD